MSNIFIAIVQINIFIFDFEYISMHYFNLLYNKLFLSGMQFETKFKVP